MKRTEQLERENEALRDHLSKLSEASGQHRDWITPARAGGVRLQRPRWG